MENSQSILIPLAQATRNLAGSVQRMFAPQFEALRERSDGLARGDIVDAAAQFLDTATETMRAARDAAQGAAQPYRKPARQIIATAQDQLHTLGKSIDTGARQLARSRQADNLITRHPYAATLVAAGVGYLVYRQWHNSHARVAEDHATITDPAHEND